MQFNKGNLKLCDSINTTIICYGRLKQNRMKEVIKHNLKLSS